MVIGVIFLIIAVLCLLAIFREGKKHNFFGAGYALIACVVLGWFSIMTLIDVLSGGGVDVGG